MIMLENNVKYVYLGICLFLAFLILSLLGSESVISEESYKYAANANEFFLNIYYVLHYFIPLFLLGPIISLVLFLLLLIIAHRFKRKSFNLALVLFLFSPAFVYFTLNPSQTLFGLVLVVAAWLLSDTKRCYLLLYFLAILVATLDYTISILMALLFVGISSFSQQKIHMRIASAISLFISTSFVFIFQKEILLVSIFESLSYFIFEFGNISGTSIIIVIFAIVGTLFFGKRYSPSIAIPGIFLFLGSLFTNNVLIFHLILSVLAAPPFYRLIYRRWSITIVKFASLSIICLFLLINLITFFIVFKDAQISQDDLALIDFLRELPQDSIVLMSSERGYFFEYQTGIHMFNKYDSSISVEDILFSTNIRNTDQLIQRQQITHIIFSQNLIDEFWQGRFFGLRVLIRDADFFQLLYSSQSYEVYQVL
jgi:hypothetical protein